MRKIYGVLSDEEKDKTKERLKPKRVIKKRNIFDTNVTIGSSIRHSTTVNSPYAID